MTTPSDTPSKENKKKLRFVYLVYCNADPIVYGVYSNKKHALSYAKELVDFREEQARRNGWQFSKYSFERKTSSQATVDSWEIMEKNIYTARIFSKHADGTPSLDDGCRVEVIRRKLLS